MTHTQATIAVRASQRLEEIAASPFPKPLGPFYDRERHPDGVINLSTAENSLLSKEVIPILSTGVLESQHLKYRSTLLRSSVPQLADLLPKYVNQNKPLRPVTRTNSIPGPGLGAILAQLIWTLCDEGDGVLLSTPYYHDYTRDIVHPAQAVPVFAHIPPSIDPMSPEIIPILRDRLIASRRDNLNIRCIILCNPHNPIPRCHPPKSIEGYIRLAQEFNLHLIVDEIFAQSVYPTKDNPNPEPFRSVLSFPAWAASSPFLQNLHVLGGPTKDLGCSGLKVGLLVTENAQVRRSVEMALQATPISGATDASVSALLANDERLHYLLAKNRTSLSRNMDICATWARSHGLGYVGANAGVYFILDLSSVANRLGLRGHEGTIVMMEKMIAHGVHINPMDLNLDPLPHRFRFIFTQEEETLRLALRRIEVALLVPEQQ